MSPGSKTVFIFGHLPANPPFWKRLSLFHDRVYQKEQALEVSKCSFLERTISYELHAIVLVLLNQAHIKRYHLVRDQVKCSMWPVKMATGHFPTESHNFAWNGHVNIDGMTTVTLQTKYDPTLPSGYPKVAYPVEMSSGSGILFRRGQSLAGRSTTDSEATGRPRRCCLPWRHRRVTWITWPPLWRSFHLPNSEIFIAPEQCIFHSDGERR